LRASRSHVAIALFRTRERASYGVELSVPGLLAVVTVKFVGARIFSP
jgi:hypothetical protein